VLIKAPKITEGTNFMFLVKKQSSDVKIIGTQQTHTPGKNDDRLCQVK